MAHIATKFRGAISEEVARTVNLEATIALAKAAIDAGVTKFVFTSTGNIYWDMNGSRPCREDDILMPAKLIYPNYAAKDIGVL